VETSPAAVGRTPKTVYKITGLTKQLAEKSVFVAAKTLVEAVQFAESDLQMQVIEQVEAVVMTAWV
jgi:hypothetical protein